MPKYELPQMSPGAQYLQLRDRAKQTGYSATCIEETGAALRKAMAPRLNRIEIDLTDQELDDLLSALAEWDDASRYHERDKDDMPLAGETVTPRQARMGALYQKLGQFLACESDHA